MVLEWLVRLLVKQYYQLLQLGNLLLVGLQNYGQPKLPRTYRRQQALQNFASRNDCPLVSDDSH